MSEHSAWAAALHSARPQATSALARIRHAGGFAGLPRAPAGRREGGRGPGASPSFCTTSAAMRRARKVNTRRPVAAREPPASRSTPATLGRDLLEAPSALGECAADVHPRGWQAPGERPAHEVGAGEEHEGGLELARVPFPLGVRASHQRGYHARVDHGRRHGARARRESGDDHPHPAVCARAGGARRGQGGEGGRDRPGSWSARSAGSRGRARPRTISTTTRASVAGPDSETVPGPHRSASGLAP